MVKLTAADASKVCPKEVMLFEGDGQQGNGRKRLLEMSNNHQRAALVREAAKKVVGRVGQ